MCVCAQLLSHVQLFGTAWTVAHQAPLSMEFSRQEYWSGLPFLTSGDFPDPGIEPLSLVCPALAVRFFFFLFFLLAVRFFTTSTTWEAHRRFLIKQDFCWNQVMEIAHHLGYGGG